MRIRGRVQSEHSREVMSRLTNWLAIALLLSCSLLLTACASRTTGVGPQGPVGPQEPVGARPLEGAPSEDLTVIESSGHLVTQEHELTGFDGVEGGLGFEVDIRQGDTFQVTTSVDENVLPYVVIRVEENVLKLGMDPNHTYVMESVEMRAEVTMPELNRLTLDLAGETTVSGFRSTGDLEIIMELASGLQGDVEAVSLSLDVSMSSGVDLSGSAQSLTLNASGSSTVDLADLAVTDADVTADTSSTITVNVSGRLDASAGSGSNITYLGNPTLGQIVSSAGGSIEPR